MNERTTCLMCPNCGHRLAVVSSFRRRLLELADGTRSKREVATLLGKTLDVVKTTMYIMRNQGYSVKFIEDFDDTKRKWKAEKENKVLDRWNAKETFKSIGHSMGLSSTTIKKHVYNAIYHRYIGSSISEIPPRSQKILNTKALQGRVKMTDDGVVQRRAGTP